MPRGRRRTNPRDATPPFAGLVMLYNTNRKISGGKDDFCEMKFIKFFPTHAGRG